MRSLLLLRLKVGLQDAGRRLWFPLDVALGSRFLQILCVIGLVDGIHLVKILLPLCLLVLSFALKS